MNIARRASRRSGERGTALPIALIVLSVITTLILAFIALTSTEPSIAMNQMRNAQARAIAESGLERAIWALTKGETAPTAAGALSDPLPAPVPAPYDGSQYVAVAAGGFIVTVATGAQPNERTITAVGYVPNQLSPIAIKKIQTTVAKVKFLDPPCAICAGGESPPGTASQIQIGGSASISASTSQGAQYCAGVTPTSAAYAEGAINSNGSPNLYAPTGGSTAQANMPHSSFSNFLFSDNDINVLKSLAKANGTYYQGNQTWTSPPPGGIVFVDTPSGNPLTSSSPSGDLISVDIHGNWSAGWSGWLVVAGSVQINGNINMTGLVYAQNDVTLHGSGGGSITGAVISTNRVDTSSTNIDTDDTGNAPLRYNCPAVRNGGGTIPQGWFVKPGAYRETSGT
jgi:hypothetical protein